MITTPIFTSAVWQQQQQKVTASNILCPNNILGGGVMHEGEGQQGAEERERENLK